MFLYTVPVDVSRNLSYGRMRGIQNRLATFHFLKCEQIFNASCGAACERSVKPLMRIVVGCTAGCSAENGDCWTSPVQAPPRQRSQEGLFVSNSEFLERWSSPSRSMGLDGETNKKASPFLRTFHNASSKLFVLRSRWGALRSCFGLLFVRVLPVERLPTSPRG